MSKLGPEAHQEIRRAVRDERARDPIITVTGLQKRLRERFNRDFDRDYLSRIVHKVARETIVEVDRTKIEERMAFTRENYRMMREELLKIVYWRPEDNQQGVAKPLARDRVEAAKTVAMLDLALLKVEIECGLYRKPIDEYAKAIHYEPLDGEIRTVIVAAWTRGGLLPKGVIDQMVPALPVYADTQPATA